MDPEIWAARIEALEVMIGQAAEDGDWIRFADLARALEALERYLEARPAELHDADGHTHDDGTAVQNRGPGGRFEEGHHHGE